MLSEKTVACFMSITLLILTVLTSMDATINRRMPTGNILPVSNSEHTTSINNKSTYNIPIKKNITVLGYSAVDYDGDHRSYESTKKYHEYLDGVSTFSYLIDKQGGLIGRPPLDELELHRQKGINSLALIHNFTGNRFNSELAATVLKDPEKRATLIGDIEEELSRYSYKGVNIDIENIPYAQRENYVSFLAALKEKLQDHSYYLVASIPAKTEENNQNSWSAGFDYKAIGQYADEVQLMTYDEHWFGGEPGPIASIEWVEEVVKYATSTIKPEKILLGIPSYGYKWASDGTCKPILPEQVYNLVENNEDQVLWDKVSKSPYYIFTNARGITFTTWFENSESISYKLDLVNKYHLGGIALWRLGFEEPEVWNVISNKLQKEIREH